MAVGRGAKVPTAEQTALGDREEDRAVLEPAAGLPSDPTTQPDVAHRPPMQIGARAVKQTGTYQTLPSLHADY